MFTVTVTTQAIPITSTQLVAGNSDPVGGPVVAGVYYLASNGSMVFIPGTQVRSIAYSA